MNPEVISVHTFNRNMLLELDKLWDIAGFYDGTSLLKNNLYY
jgi:hypothetical protein